MATTLVSQYDTIEFSSNFDKLIIAVDDDVVEVALVFDLDDILRVTLSASNGEVTLYDLSGLLEDYMRGEELHDMTFSCLVDGVTLFQQRIIYNEDDVEMSASDFIDRCFLTDLPIRTVASDDFCPLFFSFNAQPPTNYTVYAHCLVDGSIIVKTASAAWANGMIDASPSAISALFDGDYIRAYSVMLGNRFATFYVDQEERPLKFCYQNNYGVLTSISFQGVHSQKVDRGRSLSFCHGQAYEYDLSLDQIYSVQSAALDPLSAKLFLGLVRSHAVFLKSSDALLRILLSDVSFELSDAFDALSSGKFSYRFTRSIPRGIEQSSFLRIHSEPYNPIYN